MKNYTHNYKENRWDEERSLDSDVEDTFYGRVLSSPETGDNPLCFDWLVVDYPAEFFKLIAHFPDRERLALIMRYILAQSQPQRAKVLGVSAGTVCLDLERANRRLMQGDPQPHYGTHKRLAERIIRKTDPDSLGQFRVSVDKVTEVLFDPSQVRIGTTPETDVHT